MHSSLVKKQSYDYEVIAMSFHEAGHTIIAIHNLAKVYNVNVFNKPIGGKFDCGTTNYYYPILNLIEDKELLKILISSELSILYAGLIAEKKYYKDICGSDIFPKHLKQGSSDDLLSARKITSKYNLAESGAERSLFKKRIQKHVLNLLIDYWDDVRLIAHALYKKKKLSYEEIRYLLTRKSVNKNIWSEKYRSMKKIFFEGELSASESIIKQHMILHELNI